MGFRAAWGIRFPAAEARRNSAQVQEGFNSTAVVAYYIMVAKMWRMSIRAVVHLLPDVFSLMQAMVNFLMVG